MKTMVGGLLAVFVLFGISSRRCTGAEFTVIGEIRTCWFQDGVPGKRTNFNFTAEASDECARLRIYGGSHAGVEFGEYGWDGTNSYVLHKFLTNELQNTAHSLSKSTDTTTYLDKPSQARNQAQLRIFEGIDRPINNDDFESVWLAYASSAHYRARKSGEKTEPIWDMGGDASAAGKLFRAEWRLNPRPPFLPESVMDFTDGYEYSWVTESPAWSASQGAPGQFQLLTDVSKGEVRRARGTRVAHVQKMPAPFNRECTNSVFEVLAWTNINGLTLPREFRVTLYEPDLVAKSEPVLLPRRIIEGTITEARPGASSTNFSAWAPQGLVTTVSQEWPPIPGQRQHSAYYESTGVLKAPSEFAHLKTNRPTTRKQSGP